MIVYQTNAAGVYAGTIELTKEDRSPSGRYNIPFGATTVEPPEEKEGYERVLVGSVWEYREIPVPEEPAPEPEPSYEEKVSQYTAAVQAYMDETVRQRNYDSIHTACTYANSTDVIFAAEGKACLAWRDQVWRKCYEILAQIEAGEREEPQGVEEVIEELPKLEW